MRRCTAEARLRDGHSLTPQAWSALLEDERDPDHRHALIGFLGAEPPAFEPAEDIEERLDEAASTSPLTILILRRLAPLRATQMPACTG